MKRMTGDTLNASQRLSHMASLVLPLVAVLIVACDRGSGTRSVVAAVPLQDPGEDRWVVTSRMSYPWVGRSIVLLSNGKALIAGGRSSEWGRFSQTFDPLPGTWLPSGEMGIPRLKHTATTLRDGTVLVVGGGTERDFVAPGAPTLTPAPSTAEPWLGSTGVAELYDPVTDSFEPTGALRQGPRLGHMAAILNDGRVLVAGGCSSTIACPTSSEVYDPGTGSWREVGHISSPRYLAAGTVLQDGRVLLIGGTSTYIDAPWDMRGDASAEVFDPATETWTLVAPPNRRRVMGDAVTLGDGRVLVVGMEIPSDPFEYVANAELYDPATDRWTNTAPLVGLVDLDVTATVLLSGRVLVAGGSWRPKQGEPAKVQLFDAQQERWLEGPQLPLEQPVKSAGAVRLLDGRVLLAGSGQSALFVEAGLQLTDTPPPPTATETPSPTTSPSPTDTTTPSPTSTSPPTPTLTPTPPAYGFWRATSPMVVPREAHAAVRLDDGRVFVAGGIAVIEPYDRDNVCTSSAEVYDPVADTWHATAPMHKERESPTAFLLADRRIAVVGGHGRGSTGDETYWLSSYEIYDPERDTWQLIELEVPNLGTSQILLDDRHVLVSGINNADNECGNETITATLVLDLYSGSVRPGPPMSVDRMFHDVARLGDGRVLLVAGQKRVCKRTEHFGIPSWYSSPEPIRDVDVLDPRSGEFAPGPSKPDDGVMNRACPLVSLPDGTAFVVCPNASNWFRFSPTENSWDTLVSPSGNRSLPAIAQLPNGLALFAGDSSPLDWRLPHPRAHYSELYDPAANRWYWVNESEEGMTGKHGTLTPLADNQALFVGVYRKTSTDVHGVAQVYTYTTPEPHPSQVFIPVAVNRS